MTERATFYYVVVHDDEGRAIGSACLYHYRFELSLLCSGRTKKFVNFLERIVPLRVKLMVCGLPAATGDNHFRVAPEADAAEVLDCIDLAMVEIAKRHKTRRLFFREYDERQCELVKSLEALGYERNKSFAMNQTRADYRDFDDFCAQIKSNKRRVLKQSREKFGKSGLRVVHRNGHDGTAELYTDEVHKLYEAVAEGKPTLELYPPEFFRELARQMPDEAVYTCIENDERIVAIAMSLCTEQSFYQLFVGFDHEINPSCDLYFNLFFNAVDYAWRQNVSDVRLGQTSDAFKMQKLGAYQVPLFFFYRKTKRFGERRRPAQTPATTASAAVR